MVPATMTSDAVLVRSHPDCLAHVPSLGHPETPARLRVVLDALEAGREDGWTLQRAATVPSENDVLGVVRWLHSAELVERLRAAAAAAPTILDGPDNPVSAGTLRAATAAAGVAVASALDLVNGRLGRAFLAIRPGGHHAEPDRARGFCFFNNVALAAEVITRAWNLPVLVADIDVQHGNGTQQIFWRRRDVGFVSVHRYPFFPGSGAGDEVGEGPGRGTTRNVPLAAGADDDSFAGALESALEEIGGRLRPAVILVSAGFGAHAEDPMGGMAVSDAGFARMTRALIQAADTWAEGRILSVMEGGFNLDVLARLARAHVEQIAERHSA